MWLMKIGEWFDSLPIPQLAKDIIFVVVVVGAISLLSQITLGLWTPMVAGNHVKSFQIL